MAIQRSFALDEWYYCFNRGIDKRAVFDNEQDAQRFLMLLYLANGTKPIGLHGRQRPNLRGAFDTDRGRAIVALGAYCLMPNHFHILIKEITENGITTFMRKIGTAYTMYFNKKNERVGNLFLKPFRSRHVGTDRYFQRVLQYIHCNPTELYEPDWKQGKIRYMRSLERKLIEYPYSSLPGFVQRGQKGPILSQDVFDIANHPSVSTMLSESQKYYAEIADDLERSA